MDNIEDEIKRAHEIADQLSYGLGMSKEKHIEIMYDIGLTFVELMDKSNTGITHHIKVSEYIAKTYKDTNEIVSAGFMFGKIASDKITRMQFIMMYSVGMGDKKGILERVKKRFK